MARECDPVSAFGGIVACNRVVDDELGRELSETFLECVIAPGFTDGARDALAKKKALRLLAYQTPTHGALGLAAARGQRWPPGADARRSHRLGAPKREVASKRAPTADELRALDFAWRVCKHVKSNAIVFASLRRTGGVRTVGVGAGQMSRVDSVKIARVEGAAADDGLGAAPPTRSSRSATASTPSPRRAPPRSSSRAARCATTRSSRPPTSTTWRWCSPGCATSGTERWRPASQMKVLVVGGGGREHALAWALAQLAVGARGLVRAGQRRASSAVARCVPVKRRRDRSSSPSWPTPRTSISSSSGRRCRSSPGWPICCAMRGRAVFGCSRAAAEIEGSKVFAKELMARHAVPTAAFGAFSHAARGRAVHRRAAARQSRARGHQGRRARRRQGRGHRARRRRGQARAARDARRRTVGDAGRRVVVEEFLVGREVSLMALVDGERVTPLAPAEDHKTILDGDEGPMTGGMGVVSPTPVMSDLEVARAVREVLEPTARGLAAEGRPFRGLLYAGLDADRRGAARARVQLPLRRSRDAGADGAARRRPRARCCTPSPPGGRSSACASRRAPPVCVVMAAGGYPGAYRDAACPSTGSTPPARIEGVTVFHAGTRARRRSHRHRRRPRPRRHRRRRRRRRRRARRAYRRRRTTFISKAHIIAATSADEEDTREHQGRHPDGVGQRPRDDEAGRGDARRSSASRPSCASCRRIARPKRRAAYARDAEGKRHQGAHRRRRAGRAPGRRARRADDAAGDRRAAVGGHARRARLAALDGADAARPAGGDGGHRRRAERGAAGGGDPGAVGQGAVAEAQGAAQADARQGARRRRQGASRSDSRWPRSRRSAASCTPRRRARPTSCWRRRTTSSATRSARKLAALDPHNCVRLDPARGRRRREVRQRRARSATSGCATASWRATPSRRSIATTRRSPPRASTATRRGFICRIRLARFDERIVLPHERTLAGPKADRLKLKRATRAHLSQVFGLYSDPERKSDEPFAAVEKTAPALARHDQRRRRAEAVAADRQGGAGAVVRAARRREDLHRRRAPPLRDDAGAARRAARRVGEQPALVGRVRHDLPGQHGRPGPAGVPDASRGARAAVVRSRVAARARASSSSRSRRCSAGDAAAVRAELEQRGKAAARRSRSRPATASSIT